MPLKQQTKRVGVEFGTTEDKYTTSGKEEESNPEPPDFKSSALSLGHACLLIKYSTNDLYLSDSNQGLTGEFVFNLTS